MAIWPPGLPEQYVQKEKKKSKVYQTSFGESHLISVLETEKIFSQ